MKLLPSGFWYCYFVFTFKSNLIGCFSILVSPLSLCVIIHEFTSFLHASWIISISLLFCLYQDYESTNHNKHQSLQFHLLVIAVLVPIHSLNIIILLVTYMNY